MKSFAMNWGLIGDTGFVGSTLSRNIAFTASFNSKTIDDIAGKEFDAVVCAGAPAVKWLANKNPEEDLGNLTKLMDALSTIRTRHLILVSTIDVYPTAHDVNEADTPEKHVEAYGRNRRLLELFVESEFEQSTIIRLPGLFGEGLKKNIIFDLVHTNQTEKINPASRFQWYPMERLHSDLKKIVAADIRLVNIAPEPIKTADIAKALFPQVLLGPAAYPAPAYDMHTLHASLLGGTGHYHISASEIMERLKGFVMRTTA